MNNRIIITFDKSQEDIPVLVSFHENQFAYLTGGSSMTVLDIITGDRAIELWNELNNKKDNQL